jgi:hypothetical protein
VLLRLLTTVIERHPRFSPRAADQDRVRAGSYDLGLSIRPPTWVAAGYRREC